MHDKHAWPSKSSMVKGLIVDGPTRGDDGGAMHTLGVALPEPIGHRRRASRSPASAPPEAGARSRRASPRISC